MVTEQDLQILLPGDGASFKEYFDKVTNLQLSGANLKEVKQVEPGLLIEGAEFEILGQKVPLYIGSYIDNGQKFVLGIPEFDERDRAFMEINGESFEQT